MIPSSFSDNLSRGARTRLAIASAVIVNVFAVAAIHDCKGTHTSAAGGRAMRLPEPRGPSPEDTRRAMIARQAAVNHLLGVRGAPGPALKGIRWMGPTPYAQDDGAVARMTAELAPLGASVGYDDEPNSDGTLAVSMTSPPERAEVITIWGQPDRGRDTWTSAEDHACATFRDGTLTFRRCQDLGELLGPQAPRLFAFEPGPLLGASTEAAERMAGDGATMREDALRWHVDGLIDGAQPVEITARLANDRVVRIEARIPATDVGAVRNAVMARLGGAYWTRAGRAVALSEDDDAVTIAITAAR
ncbi:MAG: hypothetical protein K8W52_45830 [Deltaproteobacteria bacterium]|nr:hypothetical protein [Deltaproteobacteria bacterium]